MIPRQPRKRISARSMPPVRELPCPARADFVVASLWKTPRIMLGGVFFYGFITSSRELFILNSDAGRCEDSAPGLQREFREFLRFTPVLLFRSRVQAHSPAS